MKLRNSTPTLGAFLLVLFAAGCAGESAEQLFIQPGRFDYLDCPQLVRASQNTAKRQQELQTLIERAERDSVGKLLAIPSYRGDLLKAQGEQKMLSEVISRKQCPADTAPATTAPSRSPSRRH